jgi:hypothetical protein
LGIIDLAVRLATEVLNKTVTVLHAVTDPAQGDK